MALVIVAGLHNPKIGQKTTQSALHPSWVLGPKGLDMFAIFPCHLSKLGLLCSPKEAAHGADRVGSQRRVNNVQEELSAPFVVFRNLTEFRDIVWQ